MEIRRESELLDTNVREPITLPLERARPPVGSRLKILFAVASWGLGHSTRDLPLIQRMLEEGHAVTIISSGRALALLKQELGCHCEYLEWPDLPHGLAKNAPLFYAKFVFSLPVALRAIIAEHRAVDQLLNQQPFDRIVSDSRFGVRSRRVTSFQLSHGLRFIAPHRARLMEVFMDYVFYRCYGRTTHLIVPDFDVDGLSGDLSHNLRFLSPRRISYVGLLSGIRRQELPRDLDCYVSVSGPEPQRTILEETILDQIGDVDGRVIVSLGKPERAGESWTRHGVTVHSYVNRQQQEQLMNRARMIVSRSGYTTMMEIAELGSRALFIPTPGQTEQEYLAAYHARHGTYYSVRQNRLDLPRDLAIAADFPGYGPAYRTEESIRRFLEIVSN
ncbi:MAG TPA: glycosyltransferase [Chloroflexota bacterium]|nr:glycosyltransferase [Chloroflexota bacterium]